MESVLKYSHVGFSDVGLTLEVNSEFLLCKSIWLPLKESSLVMGLQTKGLPVQFPGRDMLGLRARSPVQGA